MLDSVKLPTLIVVFGVSGCGKSTLSKAIAASCESVYLDADDFHSEENRTLMTSGQGLNDELRRPWLASIVNGIKSQHQQGNNVILACSCLKKMYRNVFRNCFDSLRFVFLDIPMDMAVERVAKRNQHFFPETLVEAQFDDLELPALESDVLSIFAGKPVEQIMIALNLFLREPDE